MAAAACARELRRQPFAPLRRPAAAPETLASPSLPPVASSAGGAAGQIPSKRRATTMVGNRVLALISVHLLDCVKEGVPAMELQQVQRPEERRLSNMPKFIHLHLPPSSQHQREN